MMLIVMVKVLRKSAALAMMTDGQYKNAIILKVLQAIQFQWESENGYRGSQQKGRDDDNLGFLDVKSKVL